MNDLNNNKIIGKIIFLILSITLFIGFYFNEDLSGGGTSADFNNTWHYVLSLKENLLEGSGRIIMLPLHYIILSRLNFVVENKDLLRLLFCFISLLVPILFYLNLKTKFPNVNKNLLWYLSCIILILPSFRYSTIWANAHITALIFFLLSTFFFLKWTQKKQTKIDFNLISQLFFLALAVYTRQYYVIFFLYYLLIYFQKLNFFSFFKISFYTFILSLPGFWLIYEYPHYLVGSLFTYKFYNSILVNSSMMSFYLIPLFFPLLVKNMNLLSSEKKIFIISLIFSTIFVTFLSNFFDYNISLGGGFILKLSNLILGNNFLFYISSVLGFVLLTYLIKENANNLILILLIFLSFNVTIIFQKYYEPMFLLIYFIVFNSKLPFEFLKNYKNLVFLYFYFFVYAIMALVNSVYQITRNYNF